MRQHEQSKILTLAEAVAYITALGAHQTFEYTQTQGIVGSVARWKMGMGATREQWKELQALCLKHGKVTRTFRS